VEASTPASRIFRLKESTMTDYRLHCIGASGNSYKVALYLNCAGLDWEPVGVDFGGGETRTENWRASLNAMGPAQPPVVGAVGANTPAKAAGLAVGDSIVSIDGSPIAWWADAVDRIEPSAGKQLQVVIRRGTATDTLLVTPRSEHQVPEDPKSPMIGRIGVGAKTPYLTEPLSFVGAVKAGADASISSAGTIFRTLRGLANGRVSTNQVGGPILIGQMAAEEARAGVEPLLAFIALISINLAVINLLPIPVLDGGAFLFLLVEGIIRRPLPGRVREALSLLGLALIVLLMFVAFKNDILRLIGR